MLLHAFMVYAGGATGLTALQKLDLSANAFTGVVPVGLGSSKLLELRLGSNQLSGAGCVAKRCAIKKALPGHAHDSADTAHAHVHHVAVCVVVIIASGTFLACR